MKTSKKFSEQNLKDLADWIIENKIKNWGTWFNYPDLPVSSSYLQYETNSMQINFHEPVEIHGHVYNCVTAGRTVGKKWDMPISTSKIIELGHPEFAAQKKAKDSIFREETKGLLMELYNAQPPQVQEAIQSAQGLTRRKRKSQYFHISNMPECTMLVKQISYYAEGSIIMPGVNLFP